MGLIRDMVKLKFFLPREAWKMMKIIPGLIPAPIPGLSAITPAVDIACDFIYYAHMPVHRIEQDMVDAIDQTFIEIGAF